MARNVTVAWVYPTTRESGKPLNPADIAGMELSLSVDGATWSVYNTFANNVVSTTVPELEAGEWFFRGVVKDIQGRSSSPLVKSIVIPDETPPAALANLTLTLV
jgi:hypothetical protein